MTKADQPTAKGPVKPFPSLTQCYKYNAEARQQWPRWSNQVCFQQWLSSTCLREFPDLEVYMCFGCHLQQPKYVDLATKTIRVCKSFADSLFKPKSPSTMRVAWTTQVWPHFAFISRRRQKHSWTRRATIPAHLMKVETSEANDGNCFKMQPAKWSFLPWPIVSALSRYQWYKEEK